MRPAALGRVHVDERPGLLAAFAHPGAAVPVAGKPGVGADAAARRPVLLGERAAAMLKTRWRALERISLSPSRIGAIVQAALVLTQREHQDRY